MKLQEVTQFLMVFGIILTGFSVANAQQNKLNKFVTIAKVKAPAAATDDILRQGFIKSIPVYKNIKGLEFKAFSIQKIEQGTFFGGIYLWENKESAEKWFSPEWFARVKSTYGVEGAVDYYEIISDNSFLPDNFEGASGSEMTVLVKNLSEKSIKKYAAKSNGLLRSYIFKTDKKFGAILLFTDGNAVNKFAGKMKLSSRELFDTPVLLDNIQRSEK